MEYRFRENINWTRQKTEVKVTTHINKVGIGKKRTLDMSKVLTYKRLSD